MSYASGWEAGRHLEPLWETARSGGCVALSYEPQVGATPSPEPRWLWALRELALLRRCLEQAAATLARAYGEARADLDLTLWWAVAVEGLSRREAAARHGVSHTLVNERVETLNAHFEDFLFRARRLDINALAGVDAPT